ncbi:MAG TPA: hypothetical protein DFI00_01025 [Rhodospirillaceae bacterium]|nr:hypothetical protein [Alphaproteobacteria bacterium]OUT41371.1 MAG: hypothetical protein CBB62_03200 [Micavibrio sp. TMED2]HCI45854.1 hypothetical protein [Rhodospirillaceae bacterium]MAS47093.1 hypothetical protein [Alphaproteobacteria bacterium]MAX95187.1 hypothetical protein [Alphaproteobacteria bacterium]|tara:strand:+ start:23517 stop:24041 length:525 start_codon:yes stop_codon:yes gene_type:complete
MSDQSTSPLSSDLIPAPAAVLGYVGLVPFVIGALGTWLLPLPYAAYMASAQIYYAAITLSFFGAVHWGWALQRDFDAPTSSWEPYVWGVTPAVISWAVVAISSFPLMDPPGATLLSLDQTVAMLIAGLLLSLLIDLKRIRIGRFPVWYRKLRLRLTFSAVACLGISLLRIVSYG